MLGRQDNSTIAAGLSMVKLSPRFISRGLCLLVIVFAFQSSILAQTGTGYIKGEIVDVETGEALHYVTVRINGEGINRTDGAGYGGRFQLSDLWEGEYNLVFKVEGYDTLISEGVMVMNNRYTILKIKMKRSK